MGACYEVDLKIKTHKKDKLIAEVNKFIEENDIWFHDDDPVRTVDDMARKFLASHQKRFDIYDEMSYASSFDATYSWEVVLLDLWEAIKKYLDPGSYLDMWPDSGHWIKEIK